MVRRFINKPKIKNKQISRYFKTSFSIKSSSFKKKNPITPMKLSVASLIDFNFLADHTDWRAHLNANSIKIDKIPALDGASDTVVAANRCLLWNGWWQPSVKCFR